MPPCNLNTIFETHLPDLPLHARGKVRDVYAAGDHLLIVATDRLSAFDCILPTPIPDKGRVLTQMTVFWLDLLRDLAPNHFVSVRVDDYPPEFHAYSDQLEGRSMLVRRAQMIDFECVARGYLSGSGWKDYRRTGAVCGIPLPTGLLESSRLPEPIFTPATKEDHGHDINIFLTIWLATRAFLSWPRCVDCPAATLSVRSSKSPGCRHTAGC
jgi:phosphoribosylaminoimidazole-succinocarboxamide synthase